MNTPRYALLAIMLSAAALPACAVETKDEAPTADSVESSMAKVRQTLTIIGARAREDGAFRARFAADPVSVLLEYGIDARFHDAIIAEAKSPVVEEDDKCWWTCACSDCCITNINTGGPAKEEAPQ